MTDPAATDRLVDLTTVASDVVATARQIYEAGFPPAVRAPFAALVDVRSDERTALMLDQSGDVLGLTLVRDLGDTGWTFLRYFVVTAQRRGQGVGGRLWSALGRDLAERGRRRLLFDVEDPDDPTADPAEVDQRQRRVRFYQRLGAIDVQATYQPPHHGEPGTTPIPLRLMLADVDSAGRTTPPDLDVEATEHVLASVLWHRYDIGPRPI
jgi:GNAT superfamily N-acetyltransferase